jgi:hypothetical protein
MRTIHRTGMLLGAALLAMPLAAPAFADGPDLQHNNGRSSWQERGRQNEHWRPENRFNGYYGAPPVIIAPPEYYGQPGASLNFNFPLFR